MSYSGYLDRKRSRTFATSNNCNPCNTCTAPVAATSCGNSFAITSAVTNIFNGEECGATGQSSIECGLPNVCNITGPTGPAGPACC